MKVNGNFWSKIDKSGECWLWTAAKDKDGYGLFGINRKLHKAHRIMWSISHGEIDSTVHVLHVCDNTSCVNPSHLFAGDHSANMKDMMRKGRSAKGERNGNATLSNKDVLEIRKLLRTHTQAQIGAMYSINYRTVSKIKTRTTWNHI